VTVRQAERTRGASFDVVDPIVGTFAWQHMDRGSYANNSYRRTANTLRTLEGLLTDDVLLKGLRAYTERHRFQHPRPDDLFRALEAESGQDLQWFFDSAFRSPDELDFGIGEVRNESLPGTESGQARGQEPSQEPGQEKGQEPERESVVILRRHGAMRFPTEVRLVFEDGSERLLRWNLDDSLEALDGQPVPRTTAPQRERQGRWRDVRFRGGSALVSAEVDPRRLVDLDTDRTNDGARAAGGRPVGLALALRVLGWVEMNTTFYGGL
jgi:hypothetical protein